MSQYRKIYIYIASLKKLIKKRKYVSGHSPFDIYIYIYIYIPKLETSYWLKDIECSVLHE